MKYREPALIQRHPRSLANILLSLFLLLSTLIQVFLKWIPRWCWRNCSEQVPCVAVLGLVSGHPTTSLTFFPFKAWCTIVVSKSVTTGFGLDKVWFFGCLADDTLSPNQPLSNICRTFGFCREYNARIQQMNCLSSLLMNSPRWDEMKRFHLGWWKAVHDLKGNFFSIFVKVSWWITARRSWVRTVNR